MTEQERALAIAQAKAVLETLLGRGRWDLLDDQISRQQREHALDVNPGEHVVSLHPDTSELAFYPCVCKDSHGTPYCIDAGCDPPILFVPERGDFYQRVEDLVNDASNSGLLEILRWQRTLENTATQLKKAIEGSRVNWPNVEDEPQANS